MSASIIAWVTWGSSILGISPKTRECTKRENDYRESRFSACGCYIVSTFLKDNYRLCTIDEPWVLT
jgi:hypothetical protein